MAGAAQSTYSSIIWPKLSEGAETPVWTGSAFTESGRQTRILPYHESESGWSPELTALQEEHADEHAIQVASWNLAGELLAQHMTPANAVILEVGTNTGHFLRRMKTRWPDAAWVGSDFISQPLLKAAPSLPGIPLMQFDVTRCPLPDASVDAVVMLNVLEHIEHDQRALAQIARVLKPGGVLIIEVPAMRILFDYYDEHVRHFRRYGKKEFIEKLQGAGFSVERLTHLGVLAFPPFAALKLWNRVFRKSLSDDARRLLVAKEMRGSDHQALRVLMAIEGRLGQVLNYPFGIRLVAAARKEK